VTLNRRHGLQKPYGRPRRAAPTKKHPVFGSSEMGMSFAAICVAVHSRNGKRASVSVSAVKGRAEGA